MTGWTARPVSMSCCTVVRTWALGMAKPTPMLPLWPNEEPGARAMAELTPITRPPMSRSGPPEFPGLMAASVWMALMKDWSSSSPGVTGRSRALTIPDVTVESSPSGAPTATTWSPTTTSSERPNVSGVRSVRSTLTTARSYEESCPTTRPSSCLPLARTTVISPLSATLATTWLFVTMWPRPSYTQPDPVPAPSAPATRRVTTLGVALAAMLAIEPVGRVVAPTPALGAASGAPVRSNAPRSASTPPTRPPVVPASTAAARATPTTAPHPGPRRLEDAWSGVPAGCAGSSPAYEGYAGNDVEAGGAAPRAGAGATVGTGWGCAGGAPAAGASGRAPGG